MADRTKTNWTKTVHCTHIGRVLKRPHIHAPLYTVSQKRSPFTF